jgi:hypothetical protein
LFDDYNNYKKRIETLGYSSLGAETGRYIDYKYLEEIVHHALILCLLANDGKIEIGDTFSQHINIAEWEIVQENNIENHAITYSLIRRNK